MLVKVLKIGETIYKDYPLKDIFPVEFDENGEPIRWEERYILPGLEDLDMAKSYWIDTIKWLAHRELSKSDWVVIKLAELDQLKNPPNKYKDLLDKRKAIREWSDQKEQEVLQARSIEELVAIDLSLP